MPTELISMDLGSTYTKGALFSLAGDRLRLERMATTPTTPDDLRQGFSRVYQELGSAKAKLVFSSSAKGGLAIAAIGIVPELTARMAREAAVSAGGRISALFTYKLTGEDLTRLRALQPDIILFTGGLDGGNESYNRHNAKILAEAALPCPILFAGNRACRSEVQDILAKQQVLIADNVLADIDQPDVEPARTAIRQLFLSQIVHGKGLSELIRETGVTPKPTPLAMLELVRVLHQEWQEPREFCLVDIGGATTDFYSAGATTTESGVIYKGLPEPEIKRTVEGDLGMRVSAMAVLAASPQGLALALADRGLDEAALQAYVRRIRDVPEYLPASADESGYDEILAQACLRLSAQRHAGWRESVYTVEGQQQLQHGKDLCAIPVMIGTGGYLARLKAPDLPLYALNGGAGKEQYLLPRNPRWWIDRQHLFPLLANLAQDIPHAIHPFARTCLDQLKPVEASK